MSSKEKDKTRKDRRGPFKVWMNDLMGNGHLFRTIVKYGFYDTQSFTDFMIAYTQMQREEKDSGDVHPTASEKQKLREQALKARADLKEGRRLSNKSFLELSQAQRDLVCKFQSGELERKVKDANKKYGYGQGVTRMTREESVLFRVTANGLEGFNRLVEEW